MDGGQSLKSITKAQYAMDLDVLSATFAITHLYSGFNPNHHVIVRAHESYTDPQPRSSTASTTASYASRAAHDI